jgi:hypothetical protein
VTAPRILIARTGDRQGLVVAVLPPQDEYTSSERVVVGDVRQTSPEGQPEKWRAWLWPAAGGAMHVTRSCEAVDATTAELLREQLQKRAGKDGPWWGGGSS